MPEPQKVAQRAALARARALLIAVAAAVIAAASMAVTPAPAAAASAPKVVIVVGPAGSATSFYLSQAESYAAQARSYGASVYELYTPHATWSRVLSTAQGANLFIYLGHGNGYPSPYGYSVYKSDGLGLNAADGSSTVAYYGEYYVEHDIKLAANAVVILNHLCYASGNSEPGMADPSLSTARARADNFAAGFLRTNARAVFANGYGTATHIIYDLFKTSLSVSQIFWSDPKATKTYATSFASSRTPGKTGILDPYQPGKYYHSVVADLGMTAATWRSGITTVSAPAPTGTSYVNVQYLNMRTGAGTSYPVVTVLPYGTKLAVYKTSGSWLYVRIPDGRYGWVYGPMTTTSSGTLGSTSLATRYVGVSYLNMRTGAGTSYAVITTLTYDTKLTVYKSTSTNWLYVRIPDGRYGWVAGWYTR